MAPWQAKEHTRLSGRSVRPTGTVYGMPLSCPSDYHVVSPVPFIL